MIQGMIEQLVLMDEHFPAVLSLLETAMGVTFAPDERERILVESREDARSEKHYRLYEADGMSVIGHVDEYEPETIWLVVESPQAIEDRCASVFAATRYWQP